MRPFTPLVIPEPTSGLDYKLWQSAWDAAEHDSYMPTFKQTLNARRRAYAREDDAADLLANPKPQTDASLSRILPTSSMTGEALRENPRGAAGLGALVGGVTGAMGGDDPSRGERASRAAGGAAGGALGGHALGMAGSALGNHFGGGGRELAGRLAGGALGGVAGGMAGGAAGGAAYQHFNPAPPPPPSLMDRARSFIGGMKMASVDSNAYNSGFAQAIADLVGGDAHEMQKVAALIKAANMDESNNQLTPYMYGLGGGMIGANMAPENAPVRMRAAGFVGGALGGAGGAALGRHVTGGWGGQGIGGTAGMLAGGYAGNKAMQQGDPLTLQERARMAMGKQASLEVDSELNENILRTAIDQIPGGLGLGTLAGGAVVGRYGVSSDEETKNQRLGAGIGGALGGNISGHVLGGLGAGVGAATGLLGGGDPSDMASRASTNAFGGYLGGQALGTLGGGYLGGRAGRAVGGWLDKRASASGTMAEYMRDFGSPTAQGAPKMPGAAPTIGLNEDTMSSALHGFGMGAIGGAGGALAVHKDPPKTPEQFRNLIMGAGTGGLVGGTLGGTLGTLAGNAVVNAAGGSPQAIERARMANAILRYGGMGAGSFGGGYLGGRAAQAMRGPEQG